MISAASLSLLVYVALTLTTLAIICLAVMMWRDWKRNQLW
jgi:hypothetical protein